VIALGLIALIAGLLLGIYLLWVIGLILILVGLVLWFVPIGGTTRRWY
jgi:hypothetical protein